MPNLTYMTVQWAYLLALIVWVGGMITFVALFVPSLSDTLERGKVAQVIGAFLPRFRVAVMGSSGVIVLTSAVKFALWETVTPWLLARWAAIALMIGLALYDFGILAPRLKKAKDASDTILFGRIHRTAVATMSLTLVLGLAALFLS